MKVDFLLKRLTASIELAQFISVKIIQYDYSIFAFFPLERVFGTSIRTVVL